MYATRDLQNISLKKKMGRDRMKFIAQSHLCRLGSTYTHTKSQMIKTHLPSYISSALKWVPVGGGVGVKIGYRKWGENPRESFMGQLQFCVMI